MFLWLHVTLRLWNCWYRFKPCHCSVPFTETLFHFVSDHPHHCIIYLLPLLSDVCDFRIHITEFLKKIWALPNYAKDVRGISKHCGRCSDYFQGLLNADVQSAKSWHHFAKIMEAKYHEILPRSSLHTQDCKYLGKITYLVILFFLKLYTMHVKLLYPMHVIKVFDPQV